MTFLVSQVPVEVQVKQGIWGVKEKGHPYGEQLIFLV